MNQNLIIVVIIAGSLGFLAGRFYKQPAPVAVAPIEKMQCPTVSDNVIALSNDVKTYIDEHFRASERGDDISTVNLRIVGLEQSVKDMNASLANAQGAKVELDRLQKLINEWPMRREKAVKRIQTESLKDLRGLLAASCNTSPSAPAPTAPKSAEPSSTNSTPPAQPNLAAPPNPAAPSNP